MEDIKKGHQDCTIFHTSFREGCWIFMNTFKTVNLAEKSSFGVSFNSLLYVCVIKLTAWELVHKHKMESTQPWSHIVSFIIHKIDYWQVQVGVKTSTATEKYAMHRINTIQMFKAFRLAERRGATSGLWFFSHCSVQVGDGFGFQAEVYP